jgi:hypothetical protein
VENTNFLEMIQNEIYNFLGEISDPNGLRRAGFSDFTPFIFLL